MRISPEVEIALSLAANEAARRRHEFVTLEHLLYALLFDDQTALVVKHSGGDVAALKKRIETFIDTQLEVLPEDTYSAPSASLGVQRAIRRAVAHVQGSGKDQVTGANVLVAMYAERDSFAVSMLEESSVSRLDVVAYLSHGVSKLEESDGPADIKEPEEGQARGKDGKAKKNPLKAYTINLNEEAKQKRIDPLIGRSLEVARIVQVLARRKKNNPILVGDSGVGKTAIVEGLALKIVEGDVPDALKDATVYSLDFEERIKDVVQTLAATEGAILFIDEIHTIVGAGATSGGSMDASNLLKPALASGRLRCIGSTTFDEFRQHFEKDRALARRFQKVDVNEPSLPDAIAIVKGLQARYEEFHGVKYETEAIEASAQLAQRYLHDRKLPDSAIDVLDEAGAASKLAKKVDVTVPDVEGVLAKMAQIPPRQVESKDKERLKTLDRDLKFVVFGQDPAVSALVSSIKLSRAGLRAADKPIGSFLLTGPTGVGKTELAKQLAKFLGIAFHRFDMSEYMEPHTVSRLIGAPPGYVGFDQGGLLTDAVAKTPHAVVLLDEIEKAHPQVFNVLLQVMDHGKLTDHNGKATDFRHVILLMTSNVGARDMQKRAVGFGDGRISGDAEREYKLMFSPEFRNRLDARIQFASLSRDTMGSIVDKFLTELSAQLEEKKVMMVVTEAAKAYLADKGYDPDFGARPLARVIQEELKRPLGEELLFGDLEHGGTVTVEKNNSTVEGAPALRFDIKKPQEAETVH
jgi:ATP-dependent Clp protease ATP-binding subunit ClpA